MTASATMSIDWEDFGQLYGKYHYGKETAPVNGAIERQTKIILDLLDETGSKATFFVLGMLAKYRAPLVKEIAARGHEIALHGQNHEAMFTLSPQKAKEDITDSLHIAEDITGSKVHGYRAPFFSIIKENLYLLETLAEAGLLYDSSIFPLALSRYGISGFDKADKLYKLSNGMELVELPMTTGQFVRKDWPVSGGGYIRLMPPFMINKIFRNFAAAKTDTMIYMHPYEFDTQRIDVASNYPEDAKYQKAKVAALNFRWNIFRSSITDKLRTLLKEHDFKTCFEKAIFIKESTVAVPLQTR